MAPLMYGEPVNIKASMVNGDWGWQNDFALQEQLLADANQALLQLVDIAKRYF